MSQPMNQAPEMDDIQILKAQMQSKPAMMSSMVGKTAIFTLGGSLLLLLMSICPLWNAASLLHSFNYVFWAGRRLPTTIIVVCICIIVLFAFTSGLFFRRSIANQGEQSIMMVVNIFVTLFGLFLMLTAMPLQLQAETLSHDIMFDCAFSEQTHRLYEYSQVLQNMRATPECAKKFSVEECAGYQSSPPYTDFLKNMESEFLCAGFCYKAPSAATPAAQLLSMDEDVAQSRVLALAAEAAVSSAAKSYPPTLFSDSNYQASCNGMSALNIKNVAGDIGEQTYYQGVYLILIAVLTGFLKLFNLCVRKAA